MGTSLYALFGLWGYPPREYYGEPREMTLSSTCIHVLCAKTRQITGATATRQTARVATHSETSLGECGHALTSFPKSDMYGTIMVVVDQISKYASFMPATGGCTAKEAAKLFSRMQSRIGGCQGTLVIKTPASLETFGQSYLTYLVQSCTSPQISTNHPQTDNQPEHINALLECYKALRGCATKGQDEAPRYCACNIPKISKLRLHKKHKTFFKKRSLSFFILLGIIVSNDLLELTRS